MTRDRQIKAWVDGVTQARLTLRAEQAGSTVSEYVGDLIARDAAEGRLAEAAIPELLEMHYLTAMLLRVLLARELGETDADRLIERARGKAHEQAGKTVADLQGPKE